MTIREIFSEARDALASLWNTILGATLGDVLASVGGFVLMLAIVGLYFFLREMRATQR